jgi:aminopeptidase N
MLSRIILLMCLSITLFNRLPAQNLESGVSSMLAASRKESIQQPVYTLQFTIPAEKDKAISANETIAFTLVNPVADSLEIDFKQASDHLLSLQVNDKPAAIIHRQEHLLIAPSLLQKGTNRIRIGFIAGNESLNRNNDYLYALFVPDRARTVFPCFDQPDLKAVFNLGLVVPKGWQALANAVLKDSSSTETSTTYQFAPSDTLPTYLFSFTAGKYAVVEQQGMRFLYRETDSAKIARSVDSVFRLHREAIEFLSGWTGIPFPFQKVGFVAIPAFQFGGMEHPGVVQYNAPGLFLDATSTKDQLIARSSVIAHETAHMWFGDLVTMQWFNDVWMKEVFANFMADKVSGQLMGRETFSQKFLLDHTPAAFGVDRTPGANPIRQQLDNLQEAGTMYGNIIYHKAPIMMRQLELLMGEKPFQAGVREYLQRYRYSNAAWDDLIAILSKHTKENLQQWNKVWAYRPGRPVFSFHINKAVLTIQQKAETGAAATWPQQFEMALLYGDSIQTKQVAMNAAELKLPLAKQPDAILFNSGGAGYGLFPAFVSDRIFALQNPVQRAAAYINAYENMLAGSKLSADMLIQFLSKGLLRETNELNLRLITGYCSNLFWQFLPPEKREILGVALEQTLWSAMERQKETNNKKILFQAFSGIFTSPAAFSKLKNIWQQQQAPEGIKLSEDDYTSLACALALRADTTNTFVKEQIERISNTDRKARLQFLQPALSPDSLLRDQFFESLHDLNNRRKEAWIGSALSYLNHPLRQHTFEKHLPESLNMLETIQQTGDIFFPQNWLGSIFGNYQSATAWNVVETFLQTHPDYNPKLKAKILQTTDNLHRASLSVLSNKY